MRPIPSGSARASARGWERELARPRAITLPSEKHVRRGPGRTGPAPGASFAPADRAARSLEFQARGNRGPFGACRLALLALVGSCAILGCQTPPRAAIAPEEAISEVAGLVAPIEFRAVGPDGGPVDEPDSAGDALTFADAVRRAVTSDPGLQAALARVRIATADADQARLLPNPVLNVIVRWGAGSPQIEASFAQQFVQAIQLPRRSSAADNRLRGVAAEAVVSALDVISEVQQSYIAAQVSAALRPLLEERLTFVERLVTTASARLDMGEGTRGDVVTLDAQRVELRVFIDRTLLDERANRLRLARLIGEPSSPATWTLDAWSAPPIGDQPEAAWVDAGLRARPEIQAIVWRLKALGDDAALVRLLPWEGASTGLNAIGDDPWTLGPSLTTPLPIFDSGQAQRARITAEQLEARHALTQVKRTVVEDVRAAYQSLAASRTSLTRIREELIPLQRQRRQLAEDSYRAGQTDVTPLFLAEQDLRIAQTRAIEVESLAAVALVRLQRAVGGPGVAALLVQSGLPSP